MTASKWLPVVGVVLLSSISVVAQDPAKVSPASYKVILDNPTVRVFRVTGAPGNKVLHTLTPIIWRSRSHPARSRSSPTARHRGRTWPTRPPPTCRPGLTSRPMRARPRSTRSSSSSRGRIIIVTIR